MPVERRALSPDEAKRYAPGAPESEGGLRTVVRAPFRVAGAADVAAGIKTPEQAEARAQRYGDFFLDSVLMAPLLLIAPEAPLVGAMVKATPLIGKVVPSVLRAVTAGGIKAGQAAIEGKPASGIATEAALGTAGEAIGGELAPTALTKALQSVPGLVRRVETSRIAKGVGDIFSGPLEKLGSKDLYAMTGAEGRKILTAMRRTYRDAIQQRIGNRPLNVPALSDTPLGFDVAWGKLQTAWKELGPDAYRQARQQIVSELNRIDAARSGRPLAGQLFGVMNESTRAARAYIKTVAASLDKDGQLATAKLMAYVNKKGDRLAEEFGSYWPAFKDLLTRGQGVPAVVDRPAHLTLHRPPWPRYEGAPAPAATPETVASAMRLLSGAEPAVPLAAALAAKEHIPFMGRRREGPSSGDTLSGEGQ